jgi:PhnB protein
MATKFVPEGHNNVSPYLITKGAAQVIELLKTAFGATELVCMKQPDGSIGHAEVRLGDSVVMISEASDQFPARPAAIHVYLPDVDEAYQRALRAGAKSEREPADQFYGDRSAGVTDVGGNSWWIATHKEDLSEEELARRAKAAGR